MPRNLKATIVIATALPAIAFGWIAAAANGGSKAVVLRRRTAGVRIVDLPVTTPLWLLLLARGLLYPVFGNGDLEHSWGGPTLAGAWAVHLIIGVMALLAASFVLASVHSPGVATRDKTTV